MSEQLVRTEKKELVSIAGVSIPSFSQSPVTYHISEMFISGPSVGSSLVVGAVVTGLEEGLSPVNISTCNNNNIQNNIERHRKLSKSRLDACFCLRYSQCCTVSLNISALSNFELRESNI